MTALEKLLGFIVVLALVAFFGYRTGFVNGQTDEQARWNKKEQGYLLAEIEARKQHAQELQHVVDSGHITNLKNAYDNEQHIALLTRERDEARRRADHNGGLRISAAACDSRDRSVQGTAGVQTEGANPRHEASTGTIELPERIQSDLWALVGRADEVAEQLRSCQAWINDNGFYEVKEIPAPAD